MVHLQGVVVSQLSDPFAVDITPSDECVRYCHWKSNQTIRTKQSESKKYLFCKHKLPKCIKEAVFKVYLRSFQNVLSIIYIFNMFNMFLQG